MLTDIRLQQFRSYVDESFELSEGVNIIVGPNASGKTNLLEAILLLARGSSYRAKDAELVHFDAPWSRLDAHDGSEDIRTIKLDLQPTGIKKTFEVDGHIYQRLSQQKSLPIVIFEPNHLLLLTGSPELRRTYLDDLIEQTKPGFGATRRHYRRAVAQRNALLKKGFQVAAPNIFIWNLRISELAGKIVQERLALLEALNDHATDIYKSLSSTDAHVELVYQTNMSIEQYESNLLKRLEHNLERDCMLGFTTVGPHRDDLQVLLNGHVSEETASRGETRTLILVLKIIELQILASVREQAPILLLDDVFSELDGARRQALTVFLKDYQTFITTTDADVISKHLREQGRLIDLGN